MCLKLVSVKTPRLSPGASRLGHDWPRLARGMQPLVDAMAIPTQVTANDLVAALERVGFQLVNVHRARLWLERGQQLISVPCTGPLSDGAVRAILDEAGLSEAQL